MITVRTSLFIVEVALSTAIIDPFVLKINPISSLAEEKNNIQLFIIDLKIESQSAASLCSENTANFYLIFFFTNFFF